MVDNLTLTCDYSDILDFLNPVPRNAILKASLGLEIQMLDILYLRAGIRDALLAAGAGLKLGIFTLNLTAYGEELGLDPGVRPVYNLLVSLEFRY